MLREEIEIDLTRQVHEPDEKDQSVVFIEYSNKIVAALEAKAKKHNKENERKKTKVDTLKKVYKSSALDYQPSEDITKNLWCMARVNMFLKLLCGKLADVELKKIENEQQDFDISSSLIPSETDIELAKEDIKNYNLDFNFENVNDLYLDEYEKFAIEW